MATNFSQYKTPEEFASAMTALETGDPADAQLREEMFRYAAEGNVPGFSSNGKPITKDNPYSVQQGGKSVPYTTAFSASTPAATNNPAVDQANILSSILNSPLYTEEIKGAYLSEYLPGLTQANYEINAARAKEVRDAVSRQQAQADAIRSIAGNYAARGMRTPKMVTEGFAPVQRDTEAAKQNVEDYINNLVANKEVLYGVGTTDKETFMSDPTLFGSVGAGARRQALSNLQSLPSQYGLTQVENAPTSPLVADDTATATPDSGATGTPTPAPEPTPAPTTTSYKIKPGDTLSAIAKKFNTSVSSLATSNKIKNPNLIFAGKTLKIG